MTPVVEAARSWIGTPYRHQARCKGAGCDCLGLLLGVWREVRGDLPEDVPAYSMDWSEPQGDERLWRAARRWLIEKPKDQGRPGDVLLFRMRAGGVAKHLGIAGRVGANATFIHAYSGHAVAESPLSTPWRRRIVARFEFPKEG
ncbi:putative phage cell wall peptidase, NlpC/P60 family [Shimia gijangensis]|uniref:Putative phage cell wall peptidase, NlpC/P60 family n=1 Tax=Shimia gijangensis TaxID=1470563 RepID=A0A1M6EI48_9RHOB|nr:NlpC/P60 family protein [Shimia gijangensis]SHI84980.1 putative phage cell wall peptidase, NlpC/P60 family [Shimia gijangensis]